MIFIMFGLAFGNCSLNFIGCFPTTLENHNKSYQSRPRSPLSRCGPAGTANLRARRRVRFLQSNHERFLRQSKLRVVGQNPGGAVGLFFLILFLLRINTILISRRKRYTRTLFPKRKKMKRQMNDKHLLLIEKELKSKKKSN